jgi:hypothetical protein
LENEKVRKGEKIGHRLKIISIEQPERMSDVRPAKNNFQAKRQIAQLLETTKTSVIHTES